MLLHKNIFHVIIFLIIVAIPILLSAQTKSLPQLSEKAYVSVVTCSPTPGYEGGFGHSALRIQDASLKIDVIFNFGSYSENQSFFAYRILQGTLISYLDGESFKEFADRYKKKEEG